MHGFKGRWSLYDARPLPQDRARSTIPGRWVIAARRRLGYTSRVGCRAVFSVIPVLFRPKDVTEQRSGRPFPSRVSMSSPDDPSTLPPALADQIRNTSIRGRELVALARHLQRQGERQREQFVQLATLNKQVSERALQLQRDQEAWGKQKGAQPSSSLPGSDAASKLASERAELEKQVAQLREQRAQQELAAARAQALIAQKELEIEELRTEMLTLRGSPQLHCSASEQDAALREEVMSLRSALSDRDSEKTELAERMAREKRNFEQQRNDLHAEIKGLRQQLEQELSLIEQLQSERASAPPVTTPPVQADPDTEELLERMAREKRNFEQQRNDLRAEIKSLRHQLEQELNLIAQLQGQRAVEVQEPVGEVPEEEPFAAVGQDEFPREIVESASAGAQCEAAVNEFRGQLDADRENLEADIQLLSDGNFPARKPHRAKLSRLQESLEQMRMEIRQETASLRGGGRSSKGTNVPPNLRGR
ncbi:MAG: hypothetical protein K2R98_20975 [Gemmataceae bacterium]|nr:hypothetical protein [Gemmataceae bacterium]